MQGYEDFFGVVIEVLAKDEDGFAVSITVGVGEGDVGCEGNVARHLLPEETEFVACVPDVVAGGVDGVLAGAASKLALPGTTGLPISDWLLKMPMGVSKVLLGRWKSGGGATWVWVAEPGWAHDGTAGVGAVCALRCDDRDATGKGQQRGEAVHSVPGAKGEIHREDDRTAETDAEAKFSKSGAILSGYDFLGTIAVTEVTDIEAAFLVQSHSSHERERILEPLKRPARG